MKDWLGQQAALTNDQSLTSQSIAQISVLDTYSMCVCLCRFVRVCLIRWMCMHVHKYAHRWVLDHHLVPCHLSLQETLVDLLTPGNTIVI